MNTVPALPDPTVQYIREHVHGRCGQVVSRLAEAGLLPPPELITSEVEVHEWYLVSSELGGRLRDSGMTVVPFHEFAMWGRGSTGTPVEQDHELIALIAGR